jgi:hypothetical protein
MLIEALGTPPDHHRTDLDPTSYLHHFCPVLYPLRHTIAAMSRELGWKGTATAAGLSLILALILGIADRGFGAVVF